MNEELIRILFFLATAFCVAILATPLLTYVLYKFKLGKQIRDAAEAPIYAKLHAAKAGTPTMGGVLVWGTLVFIIIITAGLAKIWPQLQGLDF
jgi:phospho-N-acetylmuramoyl-pentapeptide-transferase